MSKPVLLCSFLGSCSWRVRIAKRKEEREIPILQVKKIDFEYRPVELKPNGEQQTAKFKTVNPMGQVPVLLVDGKPISQSVAIMEYLEETYPEPRMLPADPYLRAKPSILAVASPMKRIDMIYWCREVVELVVSGVHPLQSPSLIPQLGKAEWKKWADRAITRGFAALEAILGETAGRYCFGDEVTFADACLLPQVHNAYRIGVDLTPFPTVWRIYEALQQHPLVKKADPSCQPDTPPTGVPNTFDLFKEPGDQQQ